ncbi:MAG: hypothetical protein IJY28_01295 [Clostridia bacterium]|nr:hypothetical protein [Clostridia bacterium]
MKIIMCANHHAYDMDEHGRECPFCRNGVVSPWENEVPAETGVTEEYDTGLFVAELDDMESERDEVVTVTAEAADDDDWDPETAMTTVVSLIEDDEDEVPAKRISVINAPSGYKPMWDAKVGVEDLTVAEDISMAVEAEALATLEDEQVFYTSVSVTELIEDETPGEAPEANVYDWVSDGPSLLDIEQLTANDDAAKTDYDPGIIEDVDEDVLLAYRAQTGAEHAVDTHITVQLIPARSETMGGPKKKKKNKLPEAVRNAAAGVKSSPVVGWLVCTRGAHYGQSFPLVAGRNSIGCTPESDVALVRDTGVTMPRQAILTYEPVKRQFFIQPGEGGGLVYHNDVLVLRFAELKSYDRLEFGRDMYLFMALCGEAFSWDND